MSKTAKTDEVVTIHQAKTHLSRLLERVARGEEVIIARRDVSVAKLVPLARAAPKRVLGGATPCQPLT